LFLLLLMLSLQLVPSTNVDRAIQLYEMGDIPGAIEALEGLVETGSLTLDEELRAWDRLGSAYYAMGMLDRAREAYLELLKLDVHYDLPPGANPRLKRLLSEVRNNKMGTAYVASAPEGALVTLNDELLGVTPYAIDGLLEGRDYTIAVYADGYNPEVHTLTAEPGEVELRFTMSPVGAGSGSVQIADQVSEFFYSHSPDTSTYTSESAAVSNRTTAGSGETANLVNILASGASVDMTALASSGALTSRAGADSQLAGADEESGLSQLISAESGSSFLSREDIEQIMVFSDTQGSSPANVSGASGYNSRTSEQIMEVLANKKPAITRIYNKHLRTDPLLMGTVEVEMVIEPSGRISNVAVVSSNTYNPAFELELVRQIETWRFGAVDENEGSLTVRYPFNFQ
jgi:TonB family protein